MRDWASSASSPLVLLLLVSCSGSSSVLRTSAQLEGGSVASQSANGRGHGTGEDQSPGQGDSNAHIADGAGPVPITGINLKEIEIAVTCVPTKSAMGILPCHDVVASAVIRTVDNKAIPYDAISFPKAKSQWQIVDLPADVACGSNDRYRYSCFSKSASGDLANHALKVTLALEFDSVELLGASPSAPPKAGGSLNANFIDITARQLLGLTAPATPPQHSTAEASKIQIWESITGLYVTSPLYVHALAGSGQLQQQNHTGGAALCARFDSGGDSLGTWRLGSDVELLTLYRLGLSTYPMPTLGMASQAFWSSTIVTLGGRPTELLGKEAFVVFMVQGHGAQVSVTVFGPSILCVK